MCQGLNSHCFPMVGMVINPIVGVYISIIRIPIKGGMTIPNIATFDHGTYIYIYIGELMFGDSGGTLSICIYIHEYIYQKRLGSRATQRYLFLSDQGRPPGPEWQRDMEVDPAHAMLHDCWKGGISSPVLTSKLRSFLSFSPMSTFTYQLLLTKCFFRW